jgi:hypothetical protein
VTDWTALAARASKASHRLIGWIYWDPDAIAAYAALGVPDGLGWYIASRGAPLAPAGHQAVTAAFSSIHPGFIEAALGLAADATTWERITRVRDDAVAAGLRRYVPEICDGLADLGPALWTAVDALPASGRVLFAAHRGWPRTDDAVVSAWLALNCIREWRGDTHFAVLLAEGLSGTQAGLLHDAYMGYPGQWIARSRGADDAEIADALAGLEARGLATDGVVNALGISLRERLEAATDRLCEQPWRTLGEHETRRVLDVSEPAGDRLMARVDETAGPEWMPAARERR